MCSQHRLSSAMLTFSRQSSYRLNILGLSYHGSQPGSSPWGSSESDEIQIIEDEDEEDLLVDDFDGQCCRTYPYNHSKILRWAEERKKKEKDDMKEVPSTKHLDNLKIPTSCFDKPGDSTGGE